jgi:RimJ/RimL family protein N-acetyltransferase
VIGGRTERLVLEPLAHEHADALVEALGDPSVSAYLGVTEVHTVHAMHLRIERLARGPECTGERWFNFAVRRAADRVVIGRVEATTYASDDAAWAELAYLIGPAFQRQGYAREAVGWLLARLDAAGIAEQWAAVHPGNARSIALLAAVGFTRRAAPPARPLGSYDAGDLVFSRMTAR